jgi:hypothetical protein
MEYIGDRSVVEIGQTNCPNRGKGKKQIRDAPKAKGGAELANPAMNHPEKTRRDNGNHCKFERFHDRILLVGDETRCRSEIKVDRYNSPGSKDIAADESTEDGRSQLEEDQEKPNPVSNGENCFPMRRIIRVARRSTPQDPCETPKFSDAYSPMPMRSEQVISARLVVRS